MPPKKGPPDIATEIIAAPAADILSDDKQAALPTGKWLRMTPEQYLELIDLDMPEFPLKFRDISNIEAANDNKRGKILADFLTRTIM